MENNDIFVKTLLTDKIKIKPQFLSQSVKTHIQNLLIKKFEGVCSYHGYIKPRSIVIHKHSLGNVMAVSLNGDVEFKVQYFADVCNPSIGSIVQTKIVNSNKFGYLAHTGIHMHGFMPILEIIIAKASSDASLVNEDFVIGDEIFVEIIGKKFELGDKKIAAIARIIQTNSDKNILDADDNELNDDADNADPDIIDSGDLSEEEESQTSHHESDNESDDKEKSIVDSDSEEELNDDDDYDDADDDDADDYPASESEANDD
jgi:DNA-directed RNA polymerase subunit E'/Rpb7